MGNEDQENKLGQAKPIGLQMRQEIKMQNRKHHVGGLGH